MALSRREILEQIAAMKELQELQKEINGDLDGYLNGLKKLKEKTRQINDNKELEAELQAKINALLAKGDALSVQMAGEEKQKLDYLKKQTLPTML